MSLSILDTDILTLYRTRHQAVSRRVASLPASELAITVISVEEQLSGWYAMLRQVKRKDEMVRIYQHLTDSVSFLGSLQILTFSEQAVERYEQLKALKLNVGKMDLRIASIVLEAGGILVTRNLRDFRRIPGLTLEDWSQ